MKDYLKNIINRLKQTQRKKNLIKAYEGFFSSLIVFAVSLIVIVLTEAAFNFNTAARSGLFYSFILINALSFIYFVLFPVFKNITPFFKPDIFKTAKETGNYYPEIKDRLLNSIQLLEDETADYSRELIQASFKDVYEKTKDLRFTDVIKFEKTKRRNTAVISFITVLVFILFVPFAGSSYHRIVNYDKAFIEPPKYTFDINPGNKQITKGGQVNFSIKTTPDIPADITFYSKQIEDAEFEERALYPDSNGTFAFTIPSLNSSLDYYVKAEDIKSNSYKITVIDRPVINKLDLTIIPPAYSNLLRVTQTDNGSASVLPGTVIDLSVNSTKPLNNAELVFSDSSKKDLTVNTKSASGRINVLNDISYSIFIKDTSGIKNINPISYSITTLKDEYPSIKIIEPGQNVKLGLENALPIRLQITDDYGFSGLKLYYQISSPGNRGNNSGFNSADLMFNKNNKEQEVYHNWDLVPLSLKAEDMVSYYIEVADNDNVNGPKKTKSDVYTISIPSLDELFTQADETHQSSENELGKTLKEAKELSDELKRISNEMKRDKREITWEEKEKVEKALDKYESLQNKVKDVQKNIDEMRKDLTENNLLSKETLQKYMELQELLDKLSSEDMKKALDKMRDQLQSMMRDQVQNSLDDVQFDEEMFKKSVERTVDLLKRIQVEQKMDELLKRTEELSKNLEELNKETEQNDLSQNSKNEELSENQKSMQEDLKKLEEESEDLAKKMSELENMPKEEAEQLAEEMKNQKNPELNKEASENLQQMQKSSAMQQQQQMMQNMQQNLGKMEKLQQSMQQQNQMMVMGEMMKTLEDLIQLSKEQENLKNSTANQPQNSQELRESARQQNELLNNLDKITGRLANLSQKTFGITPEMGKALGEARRNMSQSINSMQNTNGRSASRVQLNAMENLNEAAMLMKNSLDMMMSGGGQGGGMMSMMQQMQKMSQQQMSLNQMTQMLNKGKLSRQQMAQMKRLAQEQQMIRKSMEQLNDEAKASGQSKKLSANLDKILEDMQEVVSDMQSQDIGDDLVQKQERILSKMLDAQRSINERDYEKERESFAGENVKRESPEMMLSTEEGKNKLRDELLNSVKEGYKQDYEDLIRRYFEALQKEKTNK